MFVQVQRLSKPCPNNILILKPKVRTLTSVFTSPSIVQSLSCLKNLTFYACLDGRWTNSVFWGPMSVHLLWKSASAWQSLDPAWTAIGQTLYMTSYWTAPGQSLDRPWTMIGFCVQSMSSPPLGSSTHFWWGITLVDWEPVLLFSLNAIFIHSLYVIGGPL